MKRQILKVLVSAALLAALSQNANLLAQEIEPESGKRKLEIEVSGGISFIRSSGELYSRISGNAKLIDQYVQFYGLSSSSAPGEIGEIKYFIPLTLSLNYKFSRQWYIKVGFEYSSGKTSAAQEYQVDWNGLDETYRYNYDYRLASLMPFVGVETRAGSFGIYANVGFNITDFTLTQNFQYSAGSNWLKVDDTFDVRGNAVALAVGGKYMIKVTQKAKLFLKVEYLYRKIGSFSGDKKSSGSTSLGETFSDTTTGTVYIYDIDPYGADDSFAYWDLYTTAPTDPGMQNVRELSVDLSSIRIMIGFSF